MDAAAAAIRPIPACAEPVPVPPTTDIRLPVGSYDTRRHCTLHGGPSEYRKWDAGTWPTPCTEATKDTMRFAQYGISHDHAAGKARVIRESGKASWPGCTSRRRGCGRNSAETPPTRACTGSPAGRRCWRITVSAPLPWRARSSRTPASRARRWSTASTGGWTSRPAATRPGSWTTPRPCSSTPAPWRAWSPPTWRCRRCSRGAWRCTAPAAAPSWSRSSRPPSGQCLDRDRDGRAKGWQTVPITHRRRYYAGLDSLLAAIRGDAPLERSLDHEFTVQATLLRAIGLALKEEGRLND